jgi:hypothetical protein
MEIGCNLQNLHIRPFNLPDMHAQIVDPLGVIPVVTATVLGKTFHGKALYVLDS